MSGWELGLALAACLAVGWLGGLVTVWAYARHVFRRKLDELPGDLLSASAARPLGPVDPPPPRPGDYLGGVERKAREEGGLP